jgi:hypothetical protein
MAKANGVVLYEGPSAIDGKPIAVIATGLNSASANGKTGDMLQTWILRQDVAPNEAIKTGADYSICGNCKHRGQDGKARTCYVKVFQAPLSVWKAWKRGRYAKAKDVAEVGMDRKVRLGSYGDPMAAPIHVWRELVSYSKGWTGYTHQWSSENGTIGWDKLCMASVDNAEEYNAAQAAGWRTFRVSAHVDNGAAEVLCPASDEAGRKTNCASCQLCMGTTSKARKSIAIVVHGATGKKHFKAA